MAESNQRGAFHSNIAGVVLTAGLDQPPAYTGQPGPGFPEGSDYQVVPEVIEAAADRAPSPSVVRRIAGSIGHAGIRGMELVAGQQFPTADQARGAHIQENPYDPNPSEGHVQARLYDMRRGFWSAFGDRVTLGSARRFMRELLDEVTEEDINDPRNEGDVL